MKQKKNVLIAVLLGLLTLSCVPVNQLSSLEKKVGDRVSIFSAATSQDTLLSYDRDYYGQHHLILTFFPAAYTPV